MHDHFGGGIPAVGEERLCQRGCVQVRRAKGNPGNTARQQRDAQARQDKDRGRAYWEPPTSSAIASTASAMRGP